MKQIDHFISGYKALVDFEKQGVSGLSIRIERNDTLSYTYHTFLTENRDTDYFFLKKVVLTLLWLIGGNKVYLKGKTDSIQEFLKKAKEDKELKITMKEMENIFSEKFVLEETKEEKEDRNPLSRIHLSEKGNRIGLDLGGSDRKVTALKNGSIVFEDETLWSPKQEKDIRYLYNGIKDSLTKAMKYLEHVDSIGISTAGIVKENKLLEPTLFRSVENGKEHVLDFFPEFMEKEFPKIPYQVINDGDISALTGPVLTGKENFLGIAMGTSLGGGYIGNGNTFRGWICELGKIPVDFSSSPYEHYAMKIKGAGSEYLSQKGIIRLCEEKGISFPGTKAVQLVSIQKEAEERNPIVLDCYKEFGKRLSSAIRLYHRFLDFENVILLGRVMTGYGGEVLKKEAEEELRDTKIKIHVPDEEKRRLGQSYVAGLMVPNEKADA
mgnify:CR=1 FL=1